MSPYCPDSHFCDREQHRACLPMFIGRSYFVFCRILFRIFWLSVDFSLLIDRFPLYSLDMNSLFLYRMSSFVHHFLSLFMESFVSHMLKIVWQSSDRS